MKADSPVRAHLMFRFLNSDQFPELVWLRDLSFADCLGMREAYTEDLLLDPGCSPTVPIMRDSWGPQRRLASGEPPNRLGLCAGARNEHFGTGPR
jgi:hypothetical protein